MSTEQPVIVQSTPTFLAASWRDCFIEYIHGPALAPDQRLKHAALVSFAERAGGPIAFLTIVGEHAFGGVDAETRKVVMENTRALDGRLKAAAMALLARGFAASAIRGVITGINLVSRASHPSKVCDTVEPACAFLAPHIGRTLADRASAEQLRAAALDVMGRAPARAAR